MKKNLDKIIIDHDHKNIKQKSFYELKNQKYVDSIKKLLKVFPQDFVLLMDQLIAEFISNLNQNEIEELINNEESRIQLLNYFINLINGLI